MEFFIGLFMGLFIGATGEYESTERVISLLRPAWLIY